MIDISSRNFDITDSIRAEILSLEEGLYKHMPQDQKIRVVLSKSAPDVFHVHMQVHFMGTDIISEHESHNFHKAVELCKGHFVKQVDKKKDMAQDRTKA